MTKEERLLKSSKSSIEQARNMLEDVTVANVEVQMLRNAATQTMQAAIELSQLVGMIDSQRRVTHSIRAFTEAERFEVAGRGIIFAIKCPPDLVNGLKMLIGKIVEVNGEPWYVTGIEQQCHIKPGSTIGLVVRALTVDETTSYKILKQLQA